jgi:hypothetical protein
MFEPISKLKKNDTALGGLALGPSCLIDQSAHQMRAIKRLQSGCEHLQSHFVGEELRLVVEQRELHVLNKDRWNELKQAVGGTELAQECIQALVWGYKYEVGLPALCALWRESSRRNPLTCDMVAKMAAVIFDIEEIVALHDIEHLAGYESSQDVGIHPITRNGETLLNLLGSTPEGPMKMEQTIGTAIRENRPLRDLRGFRKHFERADPFFNNPELRDSLPWDSSKDSRLKDALARVCAVGACLAYSGLNIGDRDRRSFSPSDFIREPLASFDFSDGYQMVYDRIREALIPIGSNLAFWRR